VRSMHASLIPRPNIRLTEVTIGASGSGATVAAVHAVPTVLSLFWGPLTFQSVQLETVTVAQEFIPKLPDVIGMGGKQTLGFERISIRNLRLALPNLELPPAEVEIAWNSDGTFNQANILTYSRRVAIDLTRAGDEVAFRSMKVRELPAVTPVTWAEDGTLPVASVPAFPDATWEGWVMETNDGKPSQPMRPLLVAGAGDGSGRLFIPDQSGMIHVIRHGATEAKLVLDLRESTAPWTTWNEEGLLGLAVHPRFKENGEFFICQSVKGGEKRMQHVSRFRMSKDHPDRADPRSEEVVLSIEQPFWNHNGGSITFGPDGYLYIGLGDGGSRNDPCGHGQRLDVLFGKILRIDVDRRDAGLAYAIPADNPFVGREGARGEIYAFGLRNPWQLAFDPPTSRLWAADVGQEVWEEINLIVKGGNYGWSATEGTKPFGSRAAAGPLIDPAWEYDHQIGKSVTGGRVYRGKAIPELVGRYVYGDFVSGKMWALAVDDAGRVTSNAAIPWSGLPIFGFGEDADGELYVCTSSPTGQGVFKLVPAAAGK